jgi:Protein of unknown function with PCYCGC motif
MSARLRLPFVVIACALGAAACRADMGASSSAPAEQRVEPQPPPQAVAVEPVVKFTLPPPAYTGPLPPLPQVTYPLPRSPKIVQAVYTFAARHPEVLHYVPCFCGCQRSGHQDNDDCFIKSRDAKGRPEWESHGMG